MANKTYYTVAYPKDSWYQILSADSVIEVEGPEHRSLNAALERCEEDAEETGEDVRVLRVEETEDGKLYSQV